MFKGHFRGVFFLAGGILRRAVIGRVMMRVMMRVIIRVMMRIVMEVVK